MLHKVQNTEIYNTYFDSSIMKQFLHIYKMYIYKLCNRVGIHFIIIRQMLLDLNCECESEDVIS